MPLENFGSILNFAEELESQDEEFYLAVAGNPACSDHKQMFEQFAANAKKKRQDRAANPPGKCY